jgi:hypothetical protein
LQGVFGGLFAAALAVPIAVTPLSLAAGAVAPRLAAPLLVPLATAGERFRVLVCRNDRAAEERAEHRAHRIAARLRRNDAPCQVVECSVVHGRFLPMKTRSGGGSLTINDNA